MYLPSGMASATVARYIKIMPMNSVFISFEFSVRLKFFGFKQHVNHINKYGDGDKE